MTAEREGLVALLAEHYPSGYVCGTDCDHPLNSPQGWAEHLADALADLLAARDRRVRGDAWDEGRDAAFRGLLLPLGEDGMRPVLPNPYRIEADA